MQIGAKKTGIVIPQRKVVTERKASEFDVALDQLEIDEGFDYVTGAKDKDGNDVAPNLKAQYGRISSAKWAPKGKTFRVFESADQSDVIEGLEVRYTVARVPFVEPVKRTKKSAEGSAE